MDTTEPSGQRDESLGQKLYDMGWRQGTLFQAPGIQFALIASNAANPVGRVLQPRNVKTKERLILITQDCDIIAEGEVEPYVEAMICGTVDVKHAARVDRNSARAFVIDPQTRLTAQARYRLSIAKDVLLGLTPEPWPNDPSRFERFVRWLARRYDRPAIPDSLVVNFQQPIERVLNRLDETAPDISAAFSRAIHEIRVKVPADERPPFELQLTFLIEGAELPDAELDALVAVDEMIRGAIDGNVVTLDETQFLTSEQITMAEYFATRPLFLEYLTYRGAEVEGAKPFPRA